MYVFLVAMGMVWASAGSTNPAAGIQTPFIQEVQTSFTGAHGLPSDRILAIEIMPEGSPVVATPHGLSVFNQKTWQAMDPVSGLEVQHLAGDEKQLWAAGGNRLASFDGKTWETFELPASVQVVCIALRRGVPYLGTTAGLWRAEASSVLRVEAFEEVPVLSVASFGDRIAVGTEVGLFLSDRTLGSFRAVYPDDGRYSWSPKKVTALAGGNDSLWFGSREGAGVLSGGKWQLFTGKEGLPYDHFTCAAVGNDGVVWFGTERGAIRYDGSRWAYRASKRWLPDDRVNDIAIAEDGTVWLATDGGVSRIVQEEMTLAEKAGRFEEIIDKRHRRMDFVVRCVLEEEGNFDTAWIRHTDNDGLYTAMYGASQAFRYGAMKDPEAKRRADRVFRGLKMLTDVTPIPGFPARSIVPADWKPDPNEGLTPEANKRMKEEDPLWKEIYPRWPTSVDGKYLWKCDTSSDEICGHYFFYGVYYDLVAETEEERREVRALVAAMTDHIVDNGYRLVDYDGLPTRWANWSPEYVNDMDGWADRGLQSVEILSFLNVARHITGDERYADAAKFLREEHDYHINAISGRAVYPPSHVVAWDNNLSFLSYYGLLKYEKDPELLKLWQASIDRNWLFVSKQNDPFFNFVYLAANPARDSDMLEDLSPDFESAREKAIDTLRRTPLLLLGWEMKNSHRLDVVQDNTPGQKPAYGWSATGEALPVDERCHIRINSDHFDLDHGRGGGFCEYEGTFYLLPYYLGLYHGFLE